jgi:hypothetical protein
VRSGSVAAPFSSRIWRRGGGVGWGGGAGVWVGVWCGSGGLEAFQGEGGLGGAWAGRRGHGSGARGSLAPAAAIRAPPHLHRVARAALAAAAAARRRLEREQRLVLVVGGPEAGAQLLVREQPPLAASVLVRDAVEQRQLRGGGECGQAGKRGHRRLGCSATANQTPRSNAGQTPLARTSNVRSG